MTRRIALFGGSFNPPHIAHELVALYVLETQPVDELWFVPVLNHAFGKSLVAFEHRFAMCELIARPLGSRARVSRAEADRATIDPSAANRTFDLIEYIHRTATEPVTLRLVIGTDILAETDQWYRWDDVVARAPLIVVGRSGYLPPAGGTVTQVQMPEISATKVRELLASRHDNVARLDQLLPREVMRYIARHNLYLAGT